MQFFQLLLMLEIFHLFQLRQCMFCAYHKSQQTFLVIDLFAVLIKRFYDQIFYLYYVSYYKVIVFNKPFQHSKDSISLVKRGVTLCRYSDLRNKRNLRIQKIVVFQIENYYFLLHSSVYIFSNISRSRGWLEIILRSSRSFSPLSDSSIHTRR